jgi:hypothetical protein
MMAHIPPSNAAQTHAVVHHETSDANVNGVFAFGAALMLAAAIIYLLVWLLFGYFASREAGSGVRDFPLAAEQQNRLPPEPRLQTNPRQDLLDLRAAEDTVLNSYGWVDKTGGVVRIPIDEAMKLTVARGLPARQTEKR